MRIIHISDPHLSNLANVRFRDLRGKRLLGYQSWYRKRRHQYQIETLHQVTAAIVAESADLVIVTGDLVHIGLESELREARAWLELLGSPAEVIVVPGNHDCYHRESWALVQQHYGPYLGLPADFDFAAGAESAHTYPLLRRVGDISVIAASSAAPVPWWEATGTLGSGQRDRLRTMLQAEGQQLRVLALHHPPLPGMASVRKALTDARELEALLAATRPDITLHGHLHRNQARAAAHGRIFCTAPPSSVRNRAPASYRVFEIHAEKPGWGLTMTLKSLNDGQIEQIEETRWLVGTDVVGAGAASLDPGESHDAGAK